MKEWQAVGLVTNKVYEHSVNRAEVCRAIFERFPTYEKVPIENYTQQRTRGPLRRNILDEAMRIVKKEYIE